MPITLEALQEIDLLVGWTEKTDKKPSKPISEIKPKGTRFEVPDDRASDADTLVEAGIAKRVVDPPADPPA